jgi:Secretion system C-terminal sorting domain
MKIQCLIICLLVTQLVEAQSFELSPLPSNPMLAPSKPVRKLAPLAPLTLPFMDDFSYSGPYPDRNLWADDKVFINNTMAHQPPSVGVATFDALDRNGKPYGVVGDVGSADTLTSNPIDLSGLSAASNVLLTFYLQPKGLCYPPNFGDSIVVEFKQNNNIWKQVAGYDGLESSRLDTFPPFVFKNIILTNPLFFHAGFQFRFRNHGRLHGTYEIWHLDYVQLRQNPRTPENFEDVAFTQVPASMLKNHTALPYKHLKTNLLEIRDSLEIGLNSHFPTAIPITDSRVGIREITTNTVLFAPYAFITGNFNPNISVTIGQPLAPIANLRATVGQAFPTQDSLIFETEYVLTNQSQATGAARNNDVVRRRTICNNEFAYDDGTAEMQFSATGSNMQTAIRFRAQVADTLRAIRFAFPHINGDAVQNLFNIKIWKDSLNTTPIYTKLNLKVLYPDNFRDTLQAFTTYQLTDSEGRAIAVPIPAGNFFIGWQNVGDVKIPIGLDRNNLKSTYNVWQFLNGVWVAMDKPLGAVMVRPVVGKYAPNGSHTLKNEDVLLSEVMRILPNPATNYLKFEFLNDNASDFKIECFNMAGQCLKTQVLQNNLFELDGFSAGIYFLKITDLKTNLIFKHKFAVIK